MAYTSIPIPAAFNVPGLSGVPSLRNVVTGLGGGPVVALADGLGLGSLFGAPQWGIFDSDGNPVLTGDAVASMDYRHDYKVSDFPTEQGAFDSYNKVQTPFVARVTFMVGGTVADRQTFLNTAEDLLASLDLYSVVTPEATYPSVNIVCLDYRRSAAQGATLMRVDISVEEVRVAADAQFTNTVKPDGSAAQSQGTSPTLPVPAALSAAAAT